MRANASQLDILLFESGGWLLGVDAGTVCNIRLVDAETLERHLDIGDFLGRHAHEEGAREHAKPRVLSVIDGDEERTVVVDHAVGTRTFSLVDLHPLPEVLRNFGAPEWLLGTSWLDERLVLLLDLFQASLAAEQRRGSDVT